MQDQTFWEKWGGGQRLANAICGGPNWNFNKEVGKDEEVEKITQDDTITLDAS